MFIKDFYFINESDVKTISVIETDLTEYWISKIKGNLFLICDSYPGFCEPHSFMVDYISW